MNVLVDTSVWIDYFRGGERSADVDFLIDENLVVTNDIVLAELTPFLRLRKQTKLIQLLNEITKFPLDINWAQVIDLQTECLSRDSNGIGIPDLIIALNAKQNELKIFSFDKHFAFISEATKLDLYVPG
jgi:hypothetical protein